MAENENNQAPEAGAAQDASQPQAGMVTQYVKDLSFENPNAPASLQNNGAAAPAIDVNVNVGVRQMNEEMYEVELKISAKATTKTQDDQSMTAFVVELAYGGLFGVRNVPEEALKTFLLIQAPMLMFPFARRVIADATRDGGFPPLMLDPINFEALYQAQQAQAGAASEPVGGSDDAPQPINLN
ncbi:protein-export protein SecB [Kordiimonas sediminis]|uniref:Protein-export protein SecB n=1 Tax=Kordiimonas sediminis TaxID=1735581 RepID=A0A919E599_9PROT|nr:protein-export chaperone SecB [Kordiimonas sediminis]GHF15285.1 protein-export protein SecB [Kordiimonas sediminis]